ncbi:Transposon TX1 uncharacterized 149 kDa protein [Vitis vinifera]|uniref:Transposon TX1 uncharacterized 149 kDa protein n=1 Tax=Vitis vinifera TaxID=29760 RepID=A0A438KP38_VITVI|nr:Transposon TX1 uncharacterized 149 kDa protein [Vitis vinifera]
MEVWSRREAIEARKGKAPAVHMRDATQEEETAITKKTWSTLFSPSADRRQGHRCCSEPIFTRGSSSSSEGRNMEEEFGMGSQMERGTRVNPLSRCPLSGNLSKEDTSASRVELKGGLSGRAGLDPRGYSVMGSPSNPIIRATRVSFFSSCSPDAPLTNPSGPILPNSVPLSQSPTENQGISKFFYEKGGDDYLNHGDIPDRVEEENQCALSNPMTESCTPKDSIVRSHKEVSVISLLMVCPPRKWPKCERYYALLTLSWNVRGLGSRNKRRMVKDFLRNKDWVALPAPGASGGILIIWDSKNLRREEVVIGSFSSQSSSLWTVVDLFGFLLFMVQTVPYFRKDFWVELFDIYGLTYPLCLQEALIRRTSDHWPIVMDTNPFMWGPTPFRRNRKYIKELENERGLVLKNAESITEEILHYFEKLYTNPTGESWGGIRAPGPDGFTIAVFQECWDVIKEDLVRVFAEFHRSGIINQSTNASFIVLIPKKSLSKRISDFRPISLITSLYKIIAKVLSGRLRGVLHETIHYTQGAFVQGRQILDAVLIANEIVDERRRSGEEGVVFKIDFEKAYDHVKWDFLDHVLERRGSVLDGGNG